MSLNRLFKIAKQKQTTRLLGQLGHDGQVRVADVAFLYFLLEHEQAA